MGARMNTRPMISASILGAGGNMNLDKEDRNPAYLEAMAEWLRRQDAVQSKIKEIDERVWHKGLMEIVRASKVKGQKVQTDLIDWMIFSMCGRVMMTMENPSGSVTIMTVDEITPECRMGLHGIDSSFENVLVLFNTALAVWKEPYPRVIDDNNSPFGPLPLK